MVTEIVDLDLGTNSSFKIMTMQGDVASRFIEFHLSYNGEVFNLQNKSVKCRYVNGRTTEEVNLVINDRVNGVCTLEIPYRITSSSQNGKCELVISQSGEILSTIPFGVEVVKSLVERAPVESSSEFGALTNALWKIDGVNAELNNINSQLDNKANLNSIFSMANMGQDIKEAMVGGSVAVVGVDTVLTENIVDNQVTPEKTSFIDTTNIFDYKKAEVVNLNMQASTRKVYSSASRPVQSIILKVNPNSNYNFSGVGIKNQHIYTTENIPQVGETVIRDIYYNANTTEDGRYYTDIQTASNENYLLICFFKDNTTDTLEIRKTMQLSKGLGLKDFSEYGVGTLSSDIKIPNISIEPDEIKRLNELNVNILSNKQLGQLEKGYLCISFDDGFATAQSNTFPIIREKNVPVTFCCWTESEIITNESYLTELKELITTYNCSIAQHGVGDFTTYGDNELYNYLKSEKEKWDTLGLSVNGLTYPNHKRNNHTRTICGNLFGVCQSGGTDYPIIYGTYNQSGARSNIFDLYRNSGTNRTLAQLKAGIDEAYEKHMIYSVMWHDTHLTTTEQQKLKDMIDYAKEKGITFITIGDIEKAI